MQYPTLYRYLPTVFLNIFSAFSPLNFVLGCKSKFENWPWLLTICPDPAPQPCLPTYCALCDKISWINTHVLKDIPILQKNISIYRYLTNLQSLSLLHCFTNLFYLINVMFCIVLLYCNRSRYYVGMNCISGQISSRWYW